MRDTIEKAIAGDRDALGALFNRYQRLVSFWVRKTCPQVCEELCQDVFVKVIENIHTLESPDRFHLWLKTITRSVIVDHVRKRKPTTVSPEFMSKLDVFDKDAFVYSDTPISNLLADEKDTVVRAALESLSEDDQEILTMYHVKGWRQHSISKAFGIPVGTVKRRLHVARKRLKAAFERLA